MRYQLARAIAILLGYLACLVGMRMVDAFALALESQKPAP